MQRRNHHRGDIDTKHSNNPVPIYIIHNSLKNKHRRLSGALIDLAPTILSIMKLPIPKAMTGKNLLDQKAADAESQDANDQTSSATGPSWLYDQEKKI